MTTRPASNAVIIIATVCVIVVLGAAANLTFVIHSVADRGGDAQLLWSTDKAYLLVETRRQGWRRSPLQFVGDVARRVFGIGFGGPSPTDTRSGVVVITLSPSGVRKVEVNNLRSLGFGVVGNDIYGVTTAGLLRWADDHFEKAPEGTERKDLSGVNFKDLEGWSGHSNVLTQPTGDMKFELEVGGDHWTVIAENHAFPEEWKAIDVRRGDAPPETVWRVDQRMRYVSREEFDAFLK